MHNQNRKEMKTIEIGKTYTFTNKFNYTTSVTVTRFNDKSVFFTNGKSNHEFRMSRKSFEDYK